MRALLTAFFILLALPTFAQERECRGKQAFDLGDGASGCLLKAGSTSITTTRTRDDGASSKTSARDAGLIDVALFGAYSPSKRVINARIKAVCRTFLPTLKKTAPNARYHRIVVQLIWPRVANPGTLVPKSEAKIAVQPAFTSGTCQGVKYFG